MMLIFAVETLGYSLLVSHCRLLNSLALWQSGLSGRSVDIWHLNDGARVHAAGAVLKGKSLCTMPHTVSCFISALHKATSTFKLWFMIIYFDILGVCFPLFLFSNTHCAYGHDWDWEVDFMAHSAPTSHIHCRHFERTALDVALTVLLNKVDFAKQCCYAKMREVCKEFQ